MIRSTLVTLLTGALALGGATAATAHGGEKDTFMLECDNGQSYEVAVGGMGAFTPGLIVGSTEVIVPISFGTFRFTAVLDGETLMSGEEPGEAKGGGNVEARNPQPTITCTFAETFVLEQEEDGLPAGTVVTFSGSVTGLLTGR